MRLLCTHVSMHSGVFCLQYSKKGKGKSHHKFILKTYLISLYVGLWQKAKLTVCDTVLSYLVMVFLCLNIIVYIVYLYKFTRVSNLLC